MIDFLKNFFSNEKSPEEKALQKRDVMMIEAGAEDEESEDAEACATTETYSGGCGGCGCRR